MLLTKSVFPEHIPTDHLSPTRPSPQECYIMIHQRIRIQSPVKITAIQGLNLQHLNFLRDSTQKTGHLSNTGHARRTTKSIYKKKKKNSFLNNQPRINKLAFLSQGSSWEPDLRSTLGKTHFTLMGKIHCLGPACPPECITCTQISSLSLLPVVHL